MKSASRLGKMRYNFTFCLVEVRAGREVRLYSV